MARNKRLPQPSKPTALELAEHTRVELVAVVNALHANGVPSWTIASVLRRLTLEAEIYQREASRVEKK